MKSYQIILLKLHIFWLIVFLFFFRKTIFLKKVGTKKYFFRLLNTIYKINEKKSFEKAIIAA